MSGYIAIWMAERGVVVWPAGAAAEHVGQGLIPGAGGEPAQARPVALGVQCVPTGAMRELTYGQATAD
jgi:hypothetical protein